MSNSLRVELGERGYDIHVGAGLLARAHAFIAPLVPGKKVIVVSDETVGAKYAPALLQSLQENGLQADYIAVKAGEGSKSFASLAALMDQLLACKPDRRTVIIALGGGVVGDLVGFAASILMRGVPFIQIPTTLLAQVDSSVGGKTAINVAAGKNLVGSFYQPLLVLADIDTLATLPPREMRAGYAEIIKYGLIMDAEFYRWCLVNAEALLGGDKKLLQHAVLKSCAMKAEIVGADEREADRRALLNFGHTFAHALEAETGYGAKLLHGEAVAIGMVMGCELSAAMGLVGTEIADELAQHFHALGMPARPGDIAHDWNAKRIASHFAADKKAEGGALTFVVLDALGRARVAKQVDAVLALRVVEAALS